MRFGLTASLLILALGSTNAVAQDAAGPPLWVAEIHHNICGVSHPRQVTNPSVVNYKKVLVATAEMKDLRARGVSPQSAEGKILRERAVDHVRRIGSRVMNKGGYCSMWKEISHRDGRAVRDLTNEVVSALSMSTASMGFGSGGLVGGASKFGSKEVYAGEAGFPGRLQEAEEGAVAEDEPEGLNWLLIGGIAVVLIAAYLGGRKSEG